MTPLTTIQSWPRAQLESAFTQREVQLETVMQENVALRAEIKTGNGLYCELRQEYDRYTEQQTDLTQREHQRHVATKERLEQQLVQAQTESTEARGNVEKALCELDDKGRQCDKLRDEAKRLEADVAAMRDTFRREADAAYCRGCEVSKQTECLGEDAKMASGKFGKRELRAHQLAHEFFGFHKLAHQVLNNLPTTAGRSLLERLDEWESLAKQVPQPPKSITWEHGVELLNKLQDLAWPKGDK